MGLNDEGKGYEDRDSFNSIGYLFILVIVMFEL